MTFRKGDPKPPGAGRVAGTPNKRTIRIREVIEAAAHEIGGLQRLVEWIKEDPENERLFWSSMFIKLLPVQIQGTGERGEIELMVTVPREEVAKTLEERGLNPFVFGTVKPPPLN